VPIVGKTKRSIWAHEERRSILSRFTLEKRVYLAQKTQFWVDNHGVLTGESTNPGVWRPKGKRREVSTNVSVVKKRIKRNSDVL